MLPRLILLIVLLSPGFARAADSYTNYVLTKDIEFAVNSSDWLTANGYTLERVRLDLSLDNGATWSIPIAYGLESQYGTNTYRWQFRVTPKMWSETCRIGVRTLWSSTTNEVLVNEGAMSEAPFAICGVRILEPTQGQHITTPTYLPLRWHEAGDDFVDISVSQDGTNFDPIATVISLQATNSYVLPIYGQTPGPYWIRIALFPDLYDTVRVEVE